MLSALIDRLHKFAAPVIVGVFVASTPTAPIAQVLFETETLTRVAIGPSCDDPGCLVSVDLTGDGLRDLVIDSEWRFSGSQRTLEILISSPRGLVRGTPLESGLRGIEAVAWGDVNEDGNVDLAFGSRSNGGRIHLGNGEGGFTSTVAIPTPADNLSLALADLDGNGHIDIITSRTYILGGPGIEFGDPIDYAGAESPLVADLDGDGRSEICVSMQRPREVGMTVRVLRYGANGLVERFSGDISGAARLVGDLTGDGAPELVLERSYLPGTGDGQFVTDEVPLPVTVESLDDFDGDGAPDILGFVEGRLAVGLNDGQGGFDRVTVDRSIPASAPVVAADTDADGHVDIAAARWDSLIIREGDGSGEFPTPSNFFAFPEYGRHHERGHVRDYNRDGNLDFYVAGEFHYGDGTGSFTLTPAGEVAPGLEEWADGEGDALDVADIDGNGVQDFVSVRYNSDHFAIMWGETDGSYTPGSTNGAPNSTATQSGTHPLMKTVAIADFNLDGHLDLAGTDSVQQVVVYDNLGDRTFGRPHTYPIPNKMDAKLMKGDFNGDGAVDLFVLYDGTKILFNAGDGTFLDESPLHLEDEWPYAVDDFDGDGADDLFYEDGITVMSPGVLKDPLNTQHGSHLRFPGGFSLAAVADLGGDGHLDVVLHSWPMQLGVLEGNGAGGFQGNEPAGTASQPSFVTGLDYHHEAIYTGDFDNDGARDLIGVTGEGFAFYHNYGGPPAYRRGQINSDDRIDVSDAISHLRCLFQGATNCTPCMDARDTNDDGRSDVSDAIVLLGWLFAGTPPPAEPFRECGRDVTSDRLGCSATGWVCQ